MKTIFSADYSVIIFATGKTNYVTFALNCAASVLLFNRIKIYIISDLDFKIPKYLQQNLTIIKPKPTHLNQGTGIKLYTDQYLQTKHTLLIDSDCLCYGSLKPLFNAFINKHVSVVGNVVDAKDWCGNIEAKSINAAFGITKLARFNGGLYYLSKSALSSNIFDKARQIALSYDELGFQRIHKNWINEEILISIAMAIYGELPAADDGKLMIDLYTDQHASALNVLNGYRKVNNPIAGNSRHRPWYPAGKLSPVIIHFGNSNLYRYPYLSQHLLLKLKAKKVPSIIAACITAFTVHIPFKTKYWLSGKLQNAN